MATAIQQFGLDKVTEAADLAKEVGGRVRLVEPDGVTTVGYDHYTVEIDNPDGVHTPLWSHITIPADFVLRQRGSVREGQTVISSHHGRRKVVSADTRGTRGPGTTTLRLEGHRSTIEAYPADSYIPVQETPGGDQ